MKYILIDIVKKRWNKENCHKEALKYNKRGEFSKYSPSAYGRALKEKWLEDQDFKKIQYLLIKQQLIICGWMIFVNT